MSGEDPFVRKGFYVGGPEHAQCSGMNYEGRGHQVLPCSNPRGFVIFGWFAFEKRIFTTQSCCTGQHRSCRCDLRIDDIVKS